MELGSSVAGSLGGDKGHKKGTSYCRHQKSHIPGQLVTLLGVGVCAARRLNLGYL